MTIHGHAALHLSQSNAVFGSRRGQHSLQPIWGKKHWFLSFQLYLDKVSSGLRPLFLCYCFISCASISPNLTLLRKGFEKKRPCLYVHGGLHTHILDLFSDHTPGSPLGCGA